MNRFKTIAMLGLIGGFGLATAGQADIDTNNEEKFVDGGSIATASGSFTDGNGTDTDELFIIDQSITLRADKWYNMNVRVAVTNGATLTIPAGTVFASEVVGGVSGSLIITEGSKIIADGTAEEPIIFTSRIDLDNWDDLNSHPTGKDPDNRGQWRTGFQEWGSIAILGDARIGDSRQLDDGTTDLPIDASTTQTAPIEGLPETGLNGIQIYGGLDDEDDSGSMNYVSLAYGGIDFNASTNAELNGMSWGGVGRGFDASHIEILNNIDDGLEIFGGAASVKNLLIWNIGDDSFDVDQGWRGQAQFVLVIQGAAGEADQGSGFGDNGFEMDGYDQNGTSGQPLTNARIYNATVIGAPEVVNRGGGLDGDSTDRLIALRDNVNVQFFNSIFMTDGQNAFNNDGDDGDGSSSPGVGFGIDGTLSFADRFTTAGDYYANDNSFPFRGAATPADLQEIYGGVMDPDANLIDIRGSVWYSINDFNEVTNQGLLPGSAPGSENVARDNLVASNSPIGGITRADDTPASNPFVVKSSDTGDGVIGNVLEIDPRAANDADASVRPLKYQAPLNGFFTQANYRGAVAPNVDWTEGWTALAAMENLSGNKINPADNPANVDATNLSVNVAAAISFQSVDGILYNVVCIDADGNEQIVATVEGDGSVINAADLLNAPIDTSRVYEVRVAGL